MVKPKLKKESKVRLGVEKPEVKKMLQTFRCRKPQVNCKCSLTVNGHQNNKLKFTALHNDRIQKNVTWEETFSFLEKTKNVKQYSCIPFKISKKK